MNNLHGWCKACKKNIILILPVDIFKFANKSGRAPIPRASHQNKKLEYDLGLRTTIDLWPSLLKKFFFEIFGKSKEKKS